MFAEVIINTNVKSLNKIFDYIVPKDMEKKVKIGARVYVPFGKGSKIEDGFVVNIKKESAFTKDLKEIARVEDISILDDDKINLAKLMARKYFCNISDCMRLMLQPGTSSKDEDKRVKEKKGKFIFLKKSIDEIENDINLNYVKSEKHKKVLRCLESNDGIFINDLEILTGVSKSIFKTIEKNGYIEIRENIVSRNPFLHKDIKRDKPKVLTEEQKKCFDEINKGIQNDFYSKSLIYGITGSGKTEIYMQLISKVLKKGKSSICLVPEISLTPQMIDRFRARFGDIIAVLHSKLSNGERFDEWQKILNDEKKIVIGARSAIFSPVKNLGLIIIDEEHDISYKSDSVPRYDAKDIASYLAKNSNCPLVLGSATPDIRTMYLANEKKINLFVLKNRANNMSLPKVKIVDMRNELKNGNRSMISFELQNEISKNLKDKKQTILFLNRRGFSTFLMCRDCGYVFKCKNCNISLTYHLQDNKLKCHYCGYEKNAVNICPKCGSKKIKYFGTGTQKLENEVRRLFTDVTTIRMDLDTVTKKNSHEKILDTFRNENIDILIGTQMVVKGHHFPNVTLVGAIAADSSLNIEDYRSTERTFQTLVQVAGRSGREEKGRVIIQTYNPDNYAIIDSQKQDYDLFYKEEIAIRKALKYPPFCDIILISFTGENLNEIKKISEIVYNKIQSVENGNFVIYKPISAPIDKIKNKYRWRIVLKCHLTNKLIDIINFGITDNSIKKSKYTRIYVDVNPNNMS